MSWGWQPKQGGHRTRWEVFFYGGMGRESKRDLPRKIERGLGWERERRGEGVGESKGSETELLWKTQVWPYWMLLLSNFFYFISFTFIIPHLPLLVLNVSC